MFKVFYTPSNSVMVSRETVRECIEYIWMGDNDEVEKNRGDYVILDENDNVVEVWR